MDFSHIGWVPCINGHLDFSLMTAGISGGFTHKETSDNQVIEFNYSYKGSEGNHTRSILSQSKVGWKDSLHKEGDGDFRVIVIGKCNNSEDLDKRAMEGKILIYLSSSEPARDKNGHSDLPWFKLLHEMKCSYRKEGAWLDIQEKLNKTFSELATELAFEKVKERIDRHLYEVKFHVDSKGFLKLKLLNTTEKPAKVEYVILRQAFYYLKYSLHSHKHHNTKIDSLTTIVPISKTNDHGLKMLGQLKRDLTRTKRAYASGANRTEHDEEGILAYMNSLNSSLYDMNIFCERIYKRECAYIDSLSSSFKAQFHRQVQFNDRKEQIKQKWRVYVGWGIASLSLIWAFLGRTFIKINEENRIDTDWGLTNFIFLTITLIIAGLYTYKKRSRRDIYRNLNSEGFERFIELYKETDEEYEKIVRKKQLEITGNMVEAICVFAFIVAVIYLPLRF